MGQLIKKLIKGVISPNERLVLKNWVQIDNTNLKLFKDKIKEFNLNNTSYFDHEKAYQKFISQTIAKKVDKVYFRQYFKYAAALVLLSFSAYFFNIYKESNNKNHVSSKEENKITLTLNDGSIKILDDDQEELSYLQSSTTEEQLIFNEIKVPKGQVFRLILSDATIVWLNAGTKIKYPKKFISSLKTRTIELEGEAFFEVAHNKNKPFIVVTNGINIEVLGTKFNVSCYAEDSNISTTLVQGSVKVSALNERNNSIIIKPSYQASFNKEKLALGAKKVNITHYTSWMQKKIIFNNTPFNELVRKIERTYNVEIINENIQIQSELFTGQFDIEGIELIFKSLSTSFYFDYEIINNKIIIKK